MDAPARQKPKLNSQDSRSTHSYLPFATKKGASFLPRPDRWQLGTGYGEGSRRRRRAFKARAMLYSTALTETPMISAISVFRS